MSLNSNILAGEFNLCSSRRAELLGHSEETNEKYYTYAPKDDMDDLIAMFNARGEVSPRSHLKLINFEQQKKPQTANLKAFS